MVNFGITMIKMDPPVFFSLKTPSPFPSKFANKRVKWDNVNGFTAS
jgi:hypothetical protein